MPADLAGYLEKKKEMLRSCYAVRPLTPEERQRQQDIRWAQQALEVQATYEGEFVVPWDRKVIAHGTDAAAVLAEAGRLTGQPIEELPLVPVVDPLQDMPI